MDFIKFFSLLLFILFCKMGFGQTQIPFYTDSIKMDGYMRQVKKKCNKIYKTSMSEKKKIRRDTIEFQMEYAIKEKKNKYILQNPYSFSNCLIVDTLKSEKEKAVVVSNEGEVLMISFVGISFPKGYSDFEIVDNELNIFESSGLLLYFENSSLIYATHGCGNPFDFIGSCGGTLSTYENYFKEGEYYNSIISGKTQHCGCGYNYIIPQKRLKKWLKEINNIIKK